MGNFFTSWVEGTKFRPSQMNAPLDDLDKSITYLKNVIVHCDGDVTYDKTTGTLAWTDVIRILFIRTDGYSIQNTIAAGNIVLSDNQFAYVDLNETNNTVLTVAKLSVSTGSASNFKYYNRIVLEYKNTTSDNYFGVFLRLKNASAFTDLTDVPSSYSGKVGNSLTVNSAENSLEFVKNSINASVAPTVNDDDTAGYSVTSRWVDTTNDKEYVCLDNTTGSAVWKETTQSASGIANLVEDATPQLGGNLDLNQFNIDLTNKPSVDLTAIGIIDSVTVDTNATGIGAALVQSSDGNFDEADASASNTMPCTAIALETGTGTKKVLRQGYFRNDSWAWVSGSIVYVDIVTGALTQTKPYSAGEQVQPVGVAYSANVLYFCPQLLIIEIAAA